MTTPVNLTSRKFRTKTEAKDEFKKILNSYKDGDALSSADAGLVIELIETYYHSPAEKIGVGVKSVFRNLAPEDVDPTRSTSCFWIEHSDGTKVNFGADKCINKIRKE